MRGLSGSWCSGEGAGGLVWPTGRSGGSRGRRWGAEAAADEGGRPDSDEHSGDSPDAFPVQVVSFHVSPRAGVASPHGSTGLHAAVLVAVGAFTVGAVLTRRTRELAHPRLANPPRSTAG